MQLSGSDITGSKLSDYMQLLVEPQKTLYYCYYFILILLLQNP